MFTIVGQRVKTEPVGTRERTIGCQRCGTARRHREHRLVRTATLFFVPVANVVEQTVWCCTSCGTRVSDGPLRLPSEQDDTAVGRALGAIGAAAQEAAPALDRLRHAAEEAYRAATDAGHAPGPSPEPGPEPAPDRAAEPAAAPAERPRPGAPKKRRL